MDHDYVLSTIRTETGIRFVHKDDCQVRPDETWVEALGRFDGCEAAIAKARDIAGNVNGCALCCPDCHRPAEEM